MPGELFLAFLNLCGFFVLLFIAEILHDKFHVHVEHSRKFLHVAGGLYALLTPLWIHSLWILITLTLIALFTLWYTKRKGLLKSLHGVSRQSFGSVLFLIPISFCYLYSLYTGKPIYFYLPILLMIISDTLAFYAGRKFNWLRYKTGRMHKTVGGSIAFFGSAFLISWFMLGANRQILLLSVGIAMVTTLIEARSQGGWDNLFVPLSAVLCIWLWGIL